MPEEIDFKIKRNGILAFLFIFFISVSTVAAESCNIDTQYALHTEESTPSYVEIDFSQHTSQIFLGSKRRVNINNISSITFHTHIPEYSSYSVEQSNNSTLSRFSNISHLNKDIIYLYCVLLI